ncbi:MAG: YIP1 family protein [Acidobacteria bacterium]|nr:YIP1 family protein [Acidobacteriota bacterium]
MSDSNIGTFQPSTPPPPPPPPPSPAASGPAPRPLHLRIPAIVLFVLGVLILIGGIANFIPGGIWTGPAFAFWGVLLFALSFVRLPQATNADEPPMSGVQKVMGIFFEPTRVFRNLRAHPHWLAALLVIAAVNALYTAAFTQRLTAEVIVNYTMEKLAESPIKPPPERMEKAKDDALQQAKQPIQQIQTAAKSFVKVFVGGTFIAALCLLGVLAFGGRINFWQAFAAMLYASLPIAVVSKILSLVILVLGSAIGVLSFYGLWLWAKGLANAGQKVSSSAAWGVSITLWILGLIFGMIFATLFSSFIS